MGPVVGKERQALTAKDFGGDIFRPQNLTGLEWGNWEIKDDDEVPNLGDWNKGGGSASISGGSSEFGVRLDEPEVFLKNPARSVKLEGPMEELPVGSLLESPG